MKGRLISTFDRIMLRKRAIIESVTDPLRLANRALAPPERGELLRQPAGRAYCLHVERAEAEIEHPFQRAVVMPRIILTHVT